MRSGDRNTKYFHAITKGKRVRNTIRAIQDENGVTYRSQRDIAMMAVSYFENLYTSQGIGDGLYEKVFQGFTHRISAEMSQDLTRPINEEEIKTIVMDIGAHRAPRPDGFTAIFYHNYWEEIGPEIKKEVEEFFQRGTFDPQLNHTNLCLIPKIYPPTGKKEVRPIALCNVSYKIISNILVNRLKAHLGSIISENQNAFIPGRMISDNIVVVHEILHSLKARRRQATSYMAVKTDITKAYDRLEWIFLSETMKAMGFDQKWISWIMECVSAVRFSVLIKGSPEGFITPQRGL